ncbi:hypothetical protein QFZ34_004443 [Phyllobacterium ifriqiyense]|uniref:Secreted protein n=1 Tax=Phyllobacterium ifriqiyense TaxID=314238 RepID=A0ABU0SFK5_9HYPH|nr:hypothetical protein [Phyllobacterium ifriqiyense]
MIQSHFLVFARRSLMLTLCAFAHDNTPNTCDISPAICVKHQYIRQPRREGTSRSKRLNRKTIIPVMIR